MEDTPVMNDDGQEGNQIYLNQHSPPPPVLDGTSDLTKDLGTINIGLLQTLTALYYSRTVLNNYYKEYETDQTDWF